MAGVIFDKLVRLTTYIEVAEKHQAAYLEQPGNGFFDPTPTIQGMVIPSAIAGIDGTVCPFVTEIKLFSTKESGSNLFVLGTVASVLGDFARAAKETGDYIASTAPEALLNSRIYPDYRQDLLRKAIEASAKQRTWRTHNLG